MGAAGAAVPTAARLPGSPRIRLFVLQQAACGIGYIYTIRERGERKREGGSVCVCVCKRDKRGEGAKERQKKEGLLYIFFFFSFSEFEMLPQDSSKSHTLAFDLQEDPFLI